MRPDRNYAHRTVYRVALVHPHFRTDGGAERAALMTLRALESKEIQVWVVSRSWQHTEGQIRLIQCNPFYLGRLWREWGFARKAAKIAKSGGFDLVQSQVRFKGCDIYRAGGGVHAEWLNQRKRINSPLREITTRISPFHAYKKKTERDLYADPNLKAVICNSKMVKNEIHHYFGFDKDKIHVIYNAVDTDYFSPDSCRTYRISIRRNLGLKSEHTVFLFVGSGFERKGLTQVLKCLARLPEDAHLLVVGKDKNMKRYVSLSQRLGIEHRVLFFGAQKDVLAYYAAANAFILPTLYDAFANTVLEAMSCGLPVITSRKCGAVDLIETGKNGFICDALDTQTLMLFMSELLSETKRVTIGRAGRETIKDFSLTNMRRQLMLLYDSILDTKDHV